MEGFDPKSFIGRSKPLDLGGIDREKARSQPVSEAERRSLSYFIDVESYTIARLPGMGDFEGMSRFAAA